MAIDPLAPIRFGLRLSIGVLRFELRVIERVLGLEEPEPIAVVVVEEEPYVAAEPAPEPEVEPEPYVAAEPPPEPEVEPEPDVVPFVTVVPEPPAPEPEPEPPAPEPQPEPPTPEPQRPQSREAETQAAEVETQPDAARHIDTEHELVGEFAEEGAEEGAGAEVHVDEPWDGYRRMRVADIRDRVLVAGSEELAVVQLYELTHRRRRTILDAIERRSRQLADMPTRR
jgi:hypothetical protein